MQLPALVAYINNINNQTQINLRVNYNTKAF